MKKLFYSLLSMFFILSLANTAISAEIKYIKLKNGSILKGKVISLSSGTYMLDVDGLGQVEVKENEISSISNSPDKSASSESIQVQSQVENLQGQIMGDEEVMADIQELMNNEEIMNVLNDQQLINDIMSYDMDKIKGNQKIQQLFNNPDMQDVMRKIDSKVSTQQP